MTNYAARIVRDAMVAWGGHSEEEIQAWISILTAAVVEDPTLGTPSVKPLPESTSGIYSQVYKNGTSVEQMQTFKTQKSVERTVTVSKTKTFEANQEISMEVKLEGFGSMGGKIGFKEGQSSTSSETDSVTETWEVDNPIRVPAHTTVEAVMFVDEGEMSVDWQARARVYCLLGKSPFSTESDLGKWLPVLDTSTDERKAYYGLDLGDRSAPDSPRYRLNGDQLIGMATGTLTAKAGVKVRTVTTEKPGTELEVQFTYPGDAYAAQFAAMLKELKSPTGASDSGTPG